MPNLGTVYRAPDGQPSLYVRTEQRAGGGPEHLFVVTRERVLFERWSDTVPDELELIVDTTGRAQANEESWLRVVAEHENEILLDLLRQACAWLPRERANELRQRYADSRPPADA